MNLENLQEKRKLVTYTYNGKDKTENHKAF